MQVKKSLQGVRVFVSLSVSDGMLKSMTVKRTDLSPQFGFSEEKASNSLAT
jgi:hypothetical protein